jgi:hypothetical protein
MWCSVLWVKTPFLFQVGKENSMSANVECPLCRLQRRTNELLEDRKAEDIASCVAAPLELMAAQVRLGSRLIAAGAFFVAHGLCEAKSFTERASGLPETGSEPHE